jgi:predicted ATPase/class 3 adenylate cyclase
MAELPSGTVTFLFTDIEGSTARWERQPEAMRAALARHDALVRAAIVEHDGHVVKTMGDAFHAAFARAPDAVAAAIEAQRRLQAEPWGEIGPIRVRMALHTGAAEERDGDYYGLPLNRAARLMSAGHGGQVLVSQATYELIRDTLPEGVSLLDLGDHHLKDLIRPERVFQLVGPGLVSDFPPLRTLDAHPHNLPAYPTVLLGREQDIARVREHLLRDDVRLETLVGPGGIGKTRLAVQLAAEILDHFEDGAFFVALAPISDPGLVASTIAQTLGMRVDGSRPAVQALGEYLHAKCMLLVLDNFEQILAAAPLVSDLLGAAPRLKILVTSRAALQVGGEHEYPVPPLGLPGRQRAMEPAALSQYGAVALFIERASAIRPDFAVTSEIAPAIAEICHRLDGLPLAIELAAARTRLLTPQAILARLERRLPLLTGGARDLPARQQTLRNAIAWSYDLLHPEEQVLFRRLAVFVGGCSLESAEAIGDADGTLGLDVLDGATSLAAQSLLTQAEGVTGEPRFGMLETIREFGLDQLATSGEEAAIRRSHAQHFLERAEAAERKLRGPEQAVWLDRVQADHDNARAALAWALGDGDAPVLALRLATALAWFWFVRHHLDDVVQLEAAISACAALTDDEDVVRTRAKALHLLAWIGRSWNDPPRTVVLCEESVALFRSIGDRQGMARSLTALGLLLRDASDYRRARFVAEEGLTVGREVGDRDEVAHALYVLASIIFYVQFVGEGAEPTLISPRPGGQIAHSADEPTRGHKPPLTNDRALAIRLLEESLAIFRQLGDTWGITIALSGGGGLTEWSWATGDFERAEAAQAETLTLRRRMKEIRAICDCLDNFAIIALGQNQSKRAIRLGAAADRLREATGARRLPVVWRTVEQEHAVMRSRLSDADFAAAWAEGRAMTLEQAVAYALEAQPSA